MTSQPTGTAASSLVSVRMPVPGGQVAVSGITAKGFHGVFAHERTDGQDFVVDVVLEIDLGPAAASDDLADTVDYGGVAAAVAGDIEALASRIADTCLRFERVTCAEVTVHKPQAPMPVRVTDVAVSLVRRRSDSSPDHVRDGEM